MPPRRKSGGKALAIVLPLVGLLLIVLCGGAGVVAYTTGLVGGEDPVDGVEAYWDAAMARDCDGMIDRVTDATWRQGGASSESEAVADCQANMSSDVQPTRPTSLTQLSESGDTAVVLAVFPPPDLPELDPELGDLGVDEEIEVEYQLAKDGRRWLIDGTASGFQPGTVGVPPGALPEVPGLETPPPGQESPPVSTSEVPTADALWGNRTDFPFEIELEDRTLTGELHQLDRYDHPDCASAALDPAVAADLVNCVGRIEAAYVGENDGIRVSQQVFTFTDDQSAASFLDNHFDGVFTPELITFTDPGDIDNSGYSESTTRAVGPHAVVTLFVSAAGDDAAVQLARDHAHALHAETSNIFVWGGP